MKTNTWTCQHPGRSLGPTGGDPWPPSTSSTDGNSVQPYKSRKVKPVLGFFNQKICVQVFLSGPDFRGPKWLLFCPRFCANCHRFFPLQIRAPKASVCGGMVFASDNNSLETFWKPFPKSLTLLVHHSIFPGKDEHGIFCHCYLTFNRGSFLPPPNLQKEPWCKILPRHKPNVWKHLTHGEAAQLHPLVLRRGSQGILGNLCWRTWKSSATEKHRFKEHGKVCFNTSS